MDGSQLGSPYGLTDISYEGCYSQKPTDQGPLSTRAWGGPPEMLGGQYCKDNFFSGLEVYFLHNLALLYILSCYFPSFLSFSFFLTILYRPFLFIP